MLCNLSFILRENPLFVGIITSPRTFSPHLYFGYYAFTAFNLMAYYITLLTEALTYFKGASKECERTQFVCAWNANYCLHLLHGKDFVFPHLICDATAE